MHVYIVCHSFLDSEGHTRRIGGVETYVEHLCRLALRNDWEVTILQRGRHWLERLLEPHVRLVLWRDLPELEQRLRVLVRQDSGIVIYSDFWCVPRRLEHPCIVLQHGVGWDYVVNRITTPVLSTINNIRKRIQRLCLFRRIRRISLSADRIIAVDTNFGNFLAAHYPFDTWSDKIVYVPNFSAVPPAARIQERWKLMGREYRVIFPRRFTPIRGALLFSEVVARLAPRFPAVRFAFIGAGECESEMRRIVNGLANVEIGCRAQEEMMEEYLQSHIAVIPTIAAEGTSLSCIEAMVSGCAVVATDVGGLPNVVVPGYNGVLCRPRVEAVEQALGSLLQQPSEVRRLGENGSRLAATALSVGVWEERILGVIEDVVGCRTRRVSAILGEGDTAAQHA